jgi:asparagine synthase (glutamine-hydrolysing)
MILGLVRREPAPPPAWFPQVGLELAGEERIATVHFGLDTEASHFQTDRLRVIAESSRPWALQADDVAEAYRRFGVMCVGHLPGRFRFVVDDDEEGRVVAASSTAPFWPLAYWSDSRTTIVSSRLLPMLRCPDVPRALDDSYVTHLVLGLSAMREGSTPIRGIRRLCPGEALVVDARGTRTVHADSLVPRQVAGPVEKLGRLLLDELGDAVERLGKRAPSVISLSGGLDSAALVGAGLQRTTSLAAISFVAPRLDPSAEVSALDSIERAWPALHVTRVDASDANDHLEDTPDLRDDPALTPLALLPGRQLVWSQARQAGFRTVIEGEGGDELFSVLPTPLDALQRGHFLNAAGHLLVPSGRRALVEQGMWLPMLPARLRHAWQTSRRPVEAHLPSFIAWEALDRPAVREATAEYLATLTHRPFAARLNEWLSAPAFVGAAMSREHLARSFGLDVAWPMLERGVLELVLGLHAAGAVRGGPEKPFLRAAVAELVPDDVRAAPKNIGLYNAFIPRVLTSSRSRAGLRDARVRTRLGGLVRFERIEAMLDGLASGRPLTAGALWQLECVICFADWYARASREHGVT